MNIRLVLQRSRKPPIAPGQIGADSAKAAKFSYSNYLRQQLFRSDLNAQDRDGILKELRLRSDTSTTLNWILAAFILALIFTILASRGTDHGKGKQPTGSDGASQPTRFETFDGPKSESSEFEETAGRYLRHIGISLVWAVGIFGGGFLIGFLFGIPRSVQSPTEPDPKATTDSPKATSNNVVRGTLTANTNLEQISDWLTKILVGVSLVEAKSISAHVLSLARLMARGDCGMGSPSLALAMLLAFTTIGFMLGYLATRMFLSPVLGLADSFAGGGNLRASAVVATEVGVSAAVGDVTEAVPPEVAAEARSILLTQQAPASTAPFETRYVHAKSLLLAGQYAKAAFEYASLVAERPLDAKLRRERLWALFNCGQHWSSEIAGLLSALREVRWSTIEKESTLNFLSLSYHYLFADTPQAAQRVIDLVNEFQAKYPQSVTAGMYINLACAHGQLAAIDRDNGIAVATNPHTQAAADAIAEALKRDPSARQRIEELMNPKSPDNDLAVFNGPTNPVQDALALPAKPGPPPAAPLPGKKWS